MDFSFNKALSNNYRSSSQKVRVMSEQWVQDNIFCPCCGHPHLTSLGNNKPVADFRCAKCLEIFELKSKKGRIDTKIADGAYNTMIGRIANNLNTDLFVLQYSINLEVLNLIVVPKFFFTPSIIEKRNPLSITARRKHWVGCNIMMNNIPSQGKIPIITNQKIHNRNTVVETYNQVKELKIYDLNRRGWLFDVLNYVNAIDKIAFNIDDLYCHEKILQEKHPENRNIKAKIRQQLQILRDKNLIEFIGKGKYRKRLL